MKVRPFAKVASTALVAFVALAILGPVAQAQPYPPSAPTIGVDDSTVCPRQKVIVSGDNWKPGTKVRIFLKPDVGFLKKAKVRRDESFTRRVRIPRGLEFGEYSVVGFGKDLDGNRVRASTAVTVSSCADADIAGTVVSDTVVTAPGGSAFTGGAITPWLVLALSLGGVGIVMLAAGVLLRRSRVWSR